MVDANEPLTSANMTVEEFDIAFNDGRVCPNCDSIFPNQDERDLHVMREEQSSEFTNSST